MPLSARAVSRSLISLLFAASLLFATSASAGSLRGVIVDPDARPVAGAEVRVIGPTGVRSARTDTDGRFEIPDLKPASYQVIVQAGGLGTPAQQIDVREPETPEVRITLSVAPLSESVVVSASQVETALSGAPASVSVVHHEEIRARQIDTVAGALRTVPGMIAHRNGGPGALTSVFPRGGESDFTLVMVDGLRVNDFGAGIDLSRLALTGVDRVEIVRGPQSALYGADAIGGVIQVVSRQSGQPSVSAAAEGGSRGTQRYSFHTAGSSRRWSWNGSADRHSSDGDEAFASNGETVTNDDWLRKHGAAGAGWQAAGLSVRAMARVSEGERGAPGPYGSDPAGFFPGVNRLARGRNNDRQIGLFADHPWGRNADSRARQRWTFTWSDLDSDFHSEFGDSAFETRRVSVRSQSDFILARSTSLSAGFEVQLERARSTFVTAANFEEVPIERRDSGYFAEVRHELGPMMTITGGIRLEHIRRDALPPDAFSTHPAFEADTQASVNPRVSWVWTVRPDERAGDTRLHASAGTGIRAPNAFEIAFTDNPALKPEHSRSFEVGVSQGLRRIGARVQLTAFHNRYDDLIVTVGTSFRDASRYRTDNIANARSQGVEISSDWRADWGLRLTAAYTWLDTRVLAVDRTATAAPPPYSVGSALARRPRHAATLALQYGRGPVVAFADVTGRGHMLDVEPNQGASAGLFDNPGYAIVDLGASVRVTRSLEVFGRGMNLFDRRYEEALGYPAPGRGGMIGARVAFGE
jgi:outer membrane cobalamin receptor